MTNPQCFISYSWDSEKHKEWVRSLATDLQSNGVSVCLDQWDTYPGIDLTKYMETAIRESDFILLVCTPKFAQKANSRRGGVGYEQAIVSGEIFAESVSKGKFVPLLKEGSKVDAFPSYIISKLYIDFRDDNAFASSLESLLRHLHKSPMYQKPPLGPKPDFGSDTVEDRNIVQQQSAKFQLVDYTKLFNYARCSPGLDLPEKKAILWSDTMIKQSIGVDVETFINHYRELFNYAWWSPGLYLHKEEAISWSDTMIKQSIGVDVETFISHYRELFNYASCSPGLDLPKEEAISWANEKILDSFKSAYETSYQ